MMKPFSFLHINNCQQESEKALGYHQHPQEQIHDVPHEKSIKD